MTSGRTFAFWIAVALAAAPATAAGPRPIEMHVDATDVTRNVLRAHLTIPAAPGPVTLAYPKWIQGEHGPTGPVVDFVGLTFAAGGDGVAWKRDDLDAFAFHLVVPPGADAVEADVEFLISAEKTGFSRAASTTANLAVLNWNQLVLHPAGPPIADQTVRASLTLPAGWRLGTALPVAGTDGPRTDFGPVSVETLCDSPVLCGRYYKEIPVGPSGGAKHFLCMAADSPDALKLSDETKAALDTLVAEAHAVFGEPPFKEYRFLVAMSDHIGHYGMEHHESSDNRGPEGMLTDPLYRKTWHGWLLAHEFVHAWNGKYRRPAGMVTADHQQPLRTGLLWVYEGLTQYYGLVLAARSGLWTPEIARENFARIAARATDQTGREWRSLEDTAVAAHYQYRAARPEGWYRRRGTDFYDEAAMVWLDADTLIREKTDGKKSLDDFCHAFYAGGDGRPRVEPYEFADVVAALNGVVANDWTAFFDERVRNPNAPPPVGGLTRGGWELTFAAEPPDLAASTETDTKKVDLSGSLGLILLEDGTVEDVAPRRPAAKAGVAAGMKLVAVDGRRYTPEAVKEAVAATGGDGSIDLLFEKNDLFQTLALSYAGGGKYPTLKRKEGVPDRLDALLTPRTGGTK